MKFILIQLILCSFALVEFPLLTNVNITDLYEFEGFVIVSFKNSYSFPCSSCFHISLNESEIVSILEVKTIPSLKFLKAGKVTNFDGKFEDEKIEKFLENPTSSSHHSYLPTQYSLFTKLQLDLFYQTNLWIEEIVKKIDRVFGLFKMTFYKSSAKDEL